MDKKLNKLSKGSTMLMKGFVYAVEVVLLVVGILGYVFSYSEVKIFLQKENAFPRLIFICLPIIIIFTAFIGTFVFSICGQKFNFKNGIIIILGVPLELLILAGYLLASDYLTDIYNISNQIITVLAIATVFIAGMKFILFLIREYKLVKETTPSKDFDDINNNK